MTKVVSKASTIHNHILFSTAAFLILTSSILRAEEAKTYEAIQAAHPGWVQVPGQFIRPDCVHEIPNGARVEVKDGKVTGDVTLNGQFIAHYDACPEAPVSTRHAAGAGMAPSGNKKGQYPGWNGWVEDSQEYLSWLGSGDNIDYESGEWYVPSNPSMNGGLIYLFNGIAPTAQDWILQPVLQYGTGYAGGGNYWTIASWMVNNSGYVFHSPLVGVNAGDRLWGFTEQTGQSGGTSYWETKANDLNTGANSWITAWTSGLHWTVAYEGVLEVYNVNYCAQLPASGYAYFFYNYVDHGFPSYYGVSPAFSGNVFKSGCGDSVYVNDTYDYTILYY